MRSVAAAMRVPLGVARARARDRAGRRPRQQRGTAVAPSLRVDWRACWWAAAFASATACFSPDLKDGVIPCGEAGCPDGMECAADGYCYRDPPDGVEVDAGGGDASFALAVGNRSGANRVYASCAGEMTEVWSAPQERATTAL